MSDNTFVLSVPAGKTYDLILTHRIYSCPDLPPWTYPSTQLIAFRTAEGFMEKVFEIAKVVTVNPFDIDSALNLPVSTKSRIKDYIGEASPRGVMAESGNYRFYFLDSTNVVDLPHAFHTNERLTGVHYFPLKQLMSRDFQDVARSTEFLSPKSKTSP